MSEHLEAAAASIGAPADLVAKSAEARAAADGVTANEVLAAWAGGTTTTSADPAAPEPDAAAPATPTEAEPIVEPQPAAMLSAGTTPAATIESVPIPETVSVEESMDWDTVTSVSSAGLKERTRTVIPGWLMSFFVVIPLFAIGYLFTGVDGPACGEAGQLQVDFRNDLVNCDLSAYEGFGGPGSVTVNYVALGSQIFSDNCASCHGEDGAGKDNFPRLAGGSVLATFGSCGDHLNWVTLGSTGWVTNVGPSYGDLNKSSVGGMSSFGSSLTTEEIASVVAFERVVFGGASVDETLIDCGLVVEEAPAEDTENTEEALATEAAALR
jgi:hypothetical protein